MYNGVNNLYTIIKYLKNFYYFFTYIFYLLILYYLDFITFTNNNINFYFKHFIYFFIIKNILIIKNCIQLNS